MEHLDEHHEPISVESKHAKQEVAEKWLNYPIAKLLFQVFGLRPDLVNEQWEQEQSSVEPDDHVDYEDNSC